MQLSCLDVPCTVLLWRDQCDEIGNNARRRVAEGRWWSDGGRGHKTKEKQSKKKEK